jgi:hypothetical protein
MSLVTREDMENNMLHLAKGIQGLEYRKFYPKDKISDRARLALERRKIFREYLEKTDKYVLPGRFHRSEKKINKWLRTLKIDLKKNQTVNPFLYASKIYDRIDTIHEKLYGSKLPSEANESCMS